MYQFHCISVKVSFDTPRPPGLETGSIAQAVDGEAILRCERDPEERFVALEGVQIGAGLDKSIGGFSFLTGGFKSGKCSYYILIS